MKTKKLMLFVYDFPHKKTQDFLFRLLVEGYKVEYCIAAPWKKLNISPSSVRIDHKHQGLIHPKKICEYFNIKYQVLDHGSQETKEYIRKNPVDLYIISGARILTKEVIEACQGRILNIHPGLLPDVRGLDTFLWSIILKKPLGITTHLITPKIDSGLLVYKEKLPIYKDDTAFDITLRLLEYQTDILIKALKKLEEKSANYEDLSKYKNSYNTKMDSKLEKEALKQLKKWIGMFADE